MEIEFLDRFFKNTQISNFIKIHTVAAELFHADRRKDGQTDRHEKANGRYFQFCKHTYKALNNEFIGS